jgi:hypothetical protein
MARKKRKKAEQDHLKVRGFFHVQLVEHDDDGVPHVVGDSGWCKNTVVNLGFRDYLCHLLADSAGSKQVEMMMIGTGTGPGAADTTLDGELNVATYSRIGTAFSSVANGTSMALALGGSTAISFLATWGSVNSHILAATTIRNIGLINNTASGGTIFAGSTYASSQWATNQDLNATYAITFT